MRRAVLVVLLAVAAALGGAGAALAGPDCGDTPGVCPPYGGNYR